MHLPLNALRAFEVSARHLSFTRAGLELNVTQTAVSQQVRKLEESLGVPLFRRLPRGLALTDEGAALLPTLAEAFGRVASAVAQLREARAQEVLTVGVVGTFAVGWLLPRLQQFQQAHSFVDLRLLTNNNQVDLAGEGLDCAIRFGDGAWHGTHAEMLLASPLSPLCSPKVAARVRQPGDLAREVLLRSYRTDEWPAWFDATGQPCPLIRGTVFDSSLAMAEAAAQGVGVALLPVRLFGHEIARGRLVRPLDIDVTLGSYWLTRLKSRGATSALEVFRDWLLAEAAH